MGGAELCLQGGGAASPRPHPSLLPPAPRGCQGGCSVLPGAQVSSRLDPSPWPQRPATPSHLF